MKKKADKIANSFLSKISEEFGLDIPGLALTGDASATAFNKAGSQSFISAGNPSGMLSPDQKTVKTKFGQESGGIMTQTKLSAELSSAQVTENAEKDNFGQQFSNVVKQRQKDKRNRTVTFDEPVLERNENEESTPRDATGNDDFGFSRQRSWTVDKKNMVREEDREESLELSGNISQGRD